MLVQTTGKNTFFGKTASLLQQNDEMGHLQVCITSCTLCLDLGRCMSGASWVQHAGKLM